jgi:type IV secretory pathway VirB9-like protein
MYYSLKLVKEDFTPTNLSVITADGKLYSFLVRLCNRSSPNSIFHLMRIQ